MTHLPITKWVSTPAGRRYVMKRGLTIEGNKPWKKPVRAKPK